MDHPTDQPTEKNFRNLELISNNSPEQEGTSAERRRLPRLNLSAEQFRLSQTGKIFSVVDLSESGMALRILDRQDFLLFPVATRLEGTLNLGGEKHSVHAVVRHLGTETIGCEFEDMAPESRKALDQFLDPKRLGAELKPLPASESGTLWYHGPSGTDLLLRRGADGQYSRMTLYVLGSFIQWTHDTGLTTGRARASDEQTELRGIVRFETLWLDTDPKADPGKLKVAKNLILSSNLAEDFKKWCTRKLEG
jgi:hypothetical protein